METTRTLLVNFLEETQQSLPRHPQTSTSIVHDSSYKLPEDTTLDEYKFTLGRILELPVGPDLGLKQWTVYTKQRVIFDASVFCSFGRTDHQERWIAQSYSFRDLKSAVRFARASTLHCGIILHITNEDRSVLQHNVTLF